MWIIDDFAAYFESGEIETGEKHYREEASAESMNATIVAIKNANELGAEIRNSLDHINEEWSQLANEVNIDRLAYVADGMMSNAVKAKINSDVETGSFDSVDEAVSWCQRA